MTDTKQITHGLLAAISCLVLNGCMGAPLAQQLLTSAVINGADNIMDNAYEAQQREALNHRVLKDSPPDDYWASFVSAGFQTAPIIEPSPVADIAPNKSSPKNMIETSPFVRVEVWNMLIGEEKLSVLEKAYAAGSPNLPPKQEWGQLRIATGALEGRKDQPIVFLVPKEIGKLSSGQQTIVQLANTGDLNIARYVSD